MMKKQYDPKQQEVIDAGPGHHLVLAPPGCGKTDILAERVIRARLEGTPIEQMLCLTFTNRAARSMRDRIAERVGTSAEGLFVGNVHRFCTQYLHDSGTLSQSTSVIDEDDVADILREIAGSATNARAAATIAALSHFARQIELEHPNELFLHLPRLTDERVNELLRQVCAAQGLPYSRATVLQVFGEAQATLSSQALPTDARLLLEKISCAKRYTLYKEEHNLIDFDDILISTYTQLSHDPSHATYRWIQVDEVQDLNPLQLAIIDELTAKADCSVVYLGDEQQAIFSFMGAKLSTLQRLKEHCSGHFHRLDRNYRSPRYLLDVYNRYAANVLGVGPDMLPTTVNDVPCAPGCLRICHSADPDCEANNIVKRILPGYMAQGGRTAIIVPTNKRADDISDLLHIEGVSHFKISGQDLFMQPEVKALAAHLEAATGSLSLICWARILRQTRVCASYADARRLAKRLRELAIDPADLLTRKGSTYVGDFCKAATEETIVVFDTETTGLDVLNDEIVQLAAVKMRGGSKVEGSEFNLFMQTTRPIPEMLGDVLNPVIEELKHHERLSQEEGLRTFMEYADGCVLLGHNVEYDYHILLSSLMRHLPSACPALRRALRFDTLRLARLLRPSLRVYKLKALLESLHLEGANSHLAHEDVDATCSLAAFCMAEGQKVLPRQEAFISLPAMQPYIEKFRTRYADLYLHTRQRLHTTAPQGEEPLMVQELRHAHRALAERKLMPDFVNGLDLVLDFLTHDVVNTAETPTLAEQLARHNADLNTYREADLCESNCLDNRQVLVTTVHKAKGLEFENVIVTGVAEGTYPFFLNVERGNDAGILEDARKLYVALSRARRRLCVTYAGQELTQGASPVGIPSWAKSPSRFLVAIADAFEQEYL